MEINTIERLKKEKNAVILAHYYVDGDVQAAADVVGDSFTLAKQSILLWQAWNLWAKR